jgi:hypothetical protein
MQQNSAKSGSWLDGFAVALSALCLLHCLALPLVVAGLPFLSQFAETHLHAQVLVAVLPLSIVALGLGYRKHRDARIVAAGAVGMLLLVVGATVAHQQLGALADRAFTVTGSLTLATAHFVNAYRSKLTSSSC